MKHFVATGVALACLTAGISALIWAVSPKPAMAHCQVPCGIYDDAARVSRLKEDATTISKAIDQIGRLAGGHDATSVNQMVRWVNTKEEHASHIIKVVSEYFLTQKVKPVAKGAEGYESYLQKLADHHAVMAAAMKAKQKPDAETADALYHAIETMGKHYQ